MRNKSFLRLRVLESEASRAMADAIAAEIHTICRHAAGPIAAGETVKAQLRRAWENLGRPPFWRVRAGWYSLSGGHWSAAAVADFQRRYRTYIARADRQAAHARMIETVKRTTSKPPDLLELAHEHQRLVARIEALEAALRLRD